MFLHLNSINSFATTTCVVVTFTEACVENIEISTVTISFVSNFTNFVDTRRKAQTYILKAGIPGIQIPQTI